MDFDKYVAVGKKGAQDICIWEYLCKLRCGKCLRGVLTKKVSKERIGVISKCKVCGSKIKKYGDKWI